ncbi:hypothetical protein BKA93DRAFT_829811 [Sparassis latifolia]
MSLDQNLFTLHISPNADDPTIVDLADPAGNLHYRKQLVPGNVYVINVYDPLSESLLATATAPSAISKHKTIQLHNPETIVELKSTGTLSFKWSFKWEEHEFEWRREECFIIRKPDPAVLVAVTKEPAGRLRTTSIQMLDYNLNRFDVHDRKGLEILILTALLTLHDTNEAYHTPSTDEPVSTTPLLPTAITGLLGFGTRRTPSESRCAPANLSDSASASSEAAPALPPKPAPRTGVELIAEKHMLRSMQGVGEANEVEVDSEGAVEEYAAYAAGLLKDEAMLFITVRSASPAQVPRVLRVVEETKRLRHKSGVADEEELHQYVVYDTAPAKGLRRINLDDPAPATKGKAYVPPTSLMVHLSKIDMPELRPPIETNRDLRLEVDASYNVTYTPVRDKRKMTVKEKEKLPNRKREKERRKGSKDHDKGTVRHPEPNKSMRPIGSRLSPPLQNASLHAPPPFPPRGASPGYGWSPPAPTGYPSAASYPLGFAPPPPIAPRPQHPSTGILDWARR